VLAKLEDMTARYQSFQVRRSHTTAVQPMCVTPRHADTLTRLPSQEQMADPSVSAEPGKFQEVAKAAAELQKAVDGHAAYRDVEQQLEEARAMLKESQGEARP
jgi:protein subunit release factor A